MTQQYEHTIKQWELTHARLAFGKYGFETGTRFTLRIGDTEIVGRTVDKQGRVWVGRGALDKLSAGQRVLIAVDDAKNEVMISPIT